MGIWGSITHIASGAFDIADSAVDDVKDVANSTADGFDDAVDATGSALSSAWHATTEEARDVAGAIEGAGLTVGHGFIAGAKFAETMVEKGAVIAYHSAVEAGEYVTRHLCDIGVGALLAGAFATLAADGEEEATFGALAAAVASEAGTKAEVDFAANLVAQALWLLPGMTLNGQIDKEKLTDILVELIEACIEASEEEVVETAGEYIAGYLIASLTALICEGKLPDDVRL